MTVETLNEAINGVDEHMVEQALEIKSTDKRRIKYLAVAAVLAVCFLGTAVGAHFVKTPVNYNDKSGGETGESIQAHREIKINGTGFTEEEIKQLIKENKEHIIEAVCFEYGLENVSIAVSIKGYSHVVCGNENTLNLDAVTLPVTVNDEIVANIEVVRVKEETVFTLGIGGEKWKKYGDALKKYPDEKIVFAFAGSGAAEVIILPDNSLISVTQDAAKLFGQGASWYSLLKTQYNTLSFNELKENVILLDEIDEATTKDKNTTAAVKEEKETQATVNHSKSMYLSTVFIEAMGNSGKKLSNEQTARITALMNDLSLQERKTPNSREFPNGGGIILRTGEDEYIFYSSQIINLNGRYYKADEASYENLIIPLTELLV